MKVSRRLERAHRLDLDRANVLARDLDLNRDPVRAIGRASVLASTRDHARVLADALPRILASGVDLDHVLVRAQKLHENLYELHNLDRALARKHDFDLPRDLVRARNLVRAVVRVQKRVQRIAAMAPVGGSTEPSVTNDDELAPRAASSAERVLARAVRLLPPGERVRDGEELEAELRELAAAGLSRQCQLGYALRAASRMWSLRRALLEPTPAPGGVR